MTNDEIDALCEQLGGFSANTRDEYLHELTGRAHESIRQLQAENAALKAEVEQACNFLNDLGRAEKDKT